jgi:ubiquinone biosynthesis accessory factor UbiJ
MPTQPPLALLDTLFDKLSGLLKPPAWAVDEVQNRLVLLINHVLQQEPEARTRLLRQKDAVILVQWRIFNLRLKVTAAGLLDRADSTAAPDLAVTVIEESPAALAQLTLRGDKPPVRIEGSVQLAAEINWLADHVRWDLEEDLARICGDAPAHLLAALAHRVMEGLRKFAARVPAASGQGAA